MNEDKQVNCAHCKKGLPQGTDVIGIHRGVIGPKGFVALEDRDIYCSEECLKDEYENGVPQEERIP